MQKIHKFRRYLQRIGIRLTRLMNPVDGHPRSDSEREASQIFRMILHDAETEIMYSPRGSQYLKCEKRSMFIVLDGDMLKIINHVYGYDVRLSTKTVYWLQRIFLEELERRRTKMEKEFTQNVKYSLKSIINKLENEQA